MKKWLWAAIVFLGIHQVPFSGVARWLRIRNTNRKIRKEVQSSLRSALDFSLLPPHVQAAIHRSKLGKRAQRAATDTILEMWKRSDRIADLVRRDKHYRLLEALNQTPDIRRETAAKQQLGVIKRRYSQSDGQ